MTREKVKELLPVLEAYANGKTIQYCNPEYHWEDVKPDEQLDFGGDVINYRIKSEPKYRQFNNSKECWEEMQKHQPFGWVKNGKMNFNIACIRTDGIVKNNGMYDSWLSFKDSFQLTFIDDTPFGIKD